MQQTGFSKEDLATEINSQPPKRGHESGQVECQSKGANCSRLRCAVRARSLRIIDNLHFVRIQSYGMAIADLTAVIPPSADPRPSEFIDLLDNEDSSNHRPDVDSFLVRQILHPCAGEG